MICRNDVGVTIEDGYPVNRFRHMEKAVRLHLQRQLGTMLKKFGMFFQIPGRTMQKKFEKQPFGGEKPTEVCLDDSFSDFPDKPLGGG